MQVRLDPDVAAIVTHRAETEDISAAKWVNRVLRGMAELVEDDTPEPPTPIGRTSRATISVATRGNRPRLIGRL